MNMKYTEYNLSDSMLQRLSAIVKGREHNAGNSLGALEARGLVVKVREGYRERGLYEATGAGRDALEQARREGW